MFNVKKGSCGSKVSICKNQLSSFLFVLINSIPLEKVLVVASQQGDAELIRGLTINIVPFDHDSSLDGLRSQQRVFFSDNQNDVLDGLKHFRFFKSL